MKGCKEDIFTLHAPLIHKAFDIQFQLAYKNGTLDALIQELGAKPNLQYVLESYFSQSGVPIENEKPIGAKNGVNLSFATDFEFIPGTLEVFLSGDKMNGDVDDPDRDFDEGPDNQSFTIRIDPQKAHMLNCPPLQDEALEVSYKRRITFDTKGGS